MNTAAPVKSAKAETLRLPEHRDAFYGGEWHKPKSGKYVELDQSRHGRVARTVRRLRRRRHRRRSAGGKEGVRRLAQHAAARARARAQAHRRRPARKRRRARDDRCRRLRQSRARDGDGRNRRCRADRVLRRPRDGNEGRLDPDGSRCRELLRARAARRRRPHHSVQSSLHVLCRQGGRAACDRQRRDHEAARTGAALLAAARRTDRRPAAARRIQHRARRPRGRLSAHHPSGRRHDRADWLGADRPGGDEGRRRYTQTRHARTRRQERADRLPGRRPR